jgi:hypothetical protein
VKDEVDHFRNLLIVNRARPARPRLIEQAVDTILEKTPAPFSNRVLVHAEFGRNRFAREAAGTRRMIRHLSAREWATRRRRTCHSRSVRSSKLNTNGASDARSYWPLY